MWKFFKVLLTRALRQIGANSSGNTAFMFACGLPVLLATCGLAIDLGTMTMKRATLQGAADEAAMAGAKQLALASVTDTTISAAVTGFLQNQLTGDDAGATNIATIDHTAGTVKVEVTENWTPFFAHFLSANVTPIVTNATAMLQGESRLCILGLHPTDPFGFNMLKNANVQAAGCAVYSNSTNSSSMTLASGSSVTASKICSGGGIVATGNKTSVPPQIDCPPLPDPLASLGAPAVGACSFTNYKITTGTASLSPGVYCGGISISGTANVTFNPGTYVIKDGFFYVAGTAVVTGTNTGFYLTGKNALLWFLGSATVNLSGAENGPLAGLLFYADRTMASIIPHIISASNVHQLTGTIYFPSTNLLIDPNSNVAENSAYTAIIALHMAINNGPNLVLNTNYGATNVPVPDGVRSSGTVVLTN
jgi:Flp pilus assembly protein TadG